MNKIFTSFSTPSNLTSLESQHIETCNCLETAYNKYSAALYGCILKIISNQEEAQQVVHDTFVDFCNKKPGTNSSSTFFTLLSICLGKVRILTNSDDKELVIKFFSPAMHNAVVHSETLVFAS